MIDVPAFWRSLSKSQRYLGIVILAAIFYASTLSLISIYKMNHFSYPDFDLGFADQSIWLLANGNEPFSTVRGVHVFGDHMHFIYLIIAPLYWIWSDVRILLIFQSFILASGLMPLYLIAKDKLGNGKIPVILSFTYLLYPALHYLNLDNFHSVSLGVPLFLWAFYFLGKREYKMLSVVIFLLLLIREEYVFTIFLMGLYTAVKYDRKKGAIISAVAIAWLLLMTNVIFPYFSGVEYLQSGRVGLKEYGSSMPEIILNMASNPVSVANKIFTEHNYQYFTDLFAPLGFIPLLYAPVILLSFPAMGLNMVIDWPYASTIHYHHTTAIIPFVFISLIYALDHASKIAIRYLKVKRCVALKCLVALVIVSSLYANISMSPEYTRISNPERIAYMIFNINTFSSEENARYEAMSRIPSNATVSSGYLFLAHLSQREIVYLFPNPFKEAYWGLENGKYMPSPPTWDTDYIIIDRYMSNDERSMVENFITSGVYRLVYESHNIRLLERNPSIPLDALPP
ncbi:MAG: DUF2079 domain-containing protein [Candidatus Aenigmarchaeota archaeon]|nr:DUF2079 domain-containing protein [Candidatus Aenigmarchaeota archaeon]